MSVLRDTDYRGKVIEISRDRNFDGQIVKLTVNLLTFILFAFHVEVFVLLQFM